MGVPRSFLEADPSHLGDPFWCGVRAWSESRLPRESPPHGMRL